MCTDLQQWAPALWGGKNLLKLNTFHGNSLRPLCPWTPGPGSFSTAPTWSKSQAESVGFPGREEDPTAGLRGAWER